jgi:outer membrane lipoprotein carrier protein
MRTERRRACLLLALALSFPSASGPALAEDGVPDPSEAILSRIQSRHRQLRSLEADFVQTSSGMSFPEPYVQQGNFAWERPGKIRWEFQSPRPALYLSDGATLWAVDEAEKSVTVFGAAGAAVAQYADLLGGMEDVRKDFALRAVAEGSPDSVAGRDVLELRPKAADSSVARLLVQSDPKTGTLAGIVTETPFGDRTDTQIVLRATDRDLPDAQFVWTKREGYRELRGD